MADQRTYDNTPDEDESVTVTVTDESTEPQETAPPLQMEAMEPPAAERVPRSVDSREQETRPDDRWVPPSYLPTPNPQPGWVFRWVRTSSLGQSDNTNVSNKFRQGWVPVKASDVPEISVMSDVNSRFPENIEIGGLLLCKAPESEVKRRREYYEDMARQQMNAVDNNFMRENDPRMPLLSPERKTRTQFGRG